MSPKALTNQSPPRAPKKSCSDPGNEPFPESALAFPARPGGARKPARFRQAGTAGLILLLILGTLWLIPQSRKQLSYLALETPGHGFSLTLRHGTINGIYYCHTTGKWNAVFSASPFTSPRRASLLAWQRPHWFANPSTWGLTFQVWHLLVLECAFLLLCLIHAAWRNRWIQAETPGSRSLSGVR